MALVLNDYFRRGTEHTPLRTYTANLPITLPAGSNLFSVGDMVELENWSNGKECDLGFVFPSNDSQSFDFLCTDGVYRAYLSFSTLCRYFHLFDEVPSSSELRLEFAIEDVEHALQGILGFTLDMCLTKTLACLAYLRPKRTEYYLRYSWPKEILRDEKFVKYVGNGLDCVEKEQNKQLCNIVKDEDLLPVYSYFANAESRGKEREYLLELHPELFV